MTIRTAPTQSNIYKALYSFLTSVLPAGTPVLQGQINRVAEPHADDFAIMWEIRRVRIETNTDSYVDSAFTASIAGTVMTVTGIDIGTIGVGNQLSGTGLESGTTTILAQTSGTAGGVGDYTVSQSQTALSQRLAAGAATFLQPMQITVQIDVHGPNGANNAAVISTLFRDPYGVDLFAASGFDVVPLYADDPKQMPFINENQQYEDRWVVEANLQANELVTGVPQQFADAITVDLLSVEVEYPL